MIDGTSLRSEACIPKPLPSLVGWGSKVEDGSGTSAVETIRGERLSVDGGDREEVDRNKVIGTLPTASGSRPAFIAIVALKLSAACEKLVMALRGSIKITHCEVDEGPPGNSNSGRDVERVPNRTRVSGRKGWIAAWGHTESRKQSRSSGSIRSTTPSKRSDKLYTPNTS